MTTSERTPQEPADLKGTQEKVEELQHLKAQAMLGGGVKRIEAQHKKGKLTARERLDPVRPVVHDRGPAEAGRASGEGDVLVVRTEDLDPHLLDAVRSGLAELDRGTQGLDWGPARKGVYRCERQLYLSQPAARSVLG